MMIIGWDLDMSEDRLAIEKGYTDALGKWRGATVETCSVLRAAMGQPTTQKQEDDVWVLRRGQSRRLRTSAEIVLEDGTVLRVETALPQDLPPGYHKVRYCDREQETHLIVSPGLCYLPERMRIWGWSTQLYALRSTQSWGIGDFADMRELGRWSAREFQAGVMLVNPLGATAPTLPQQPSSYFPSSRIYRNLLYLRIEEIPGAQESISDLQGLAAAGKALNADRRIDRDAVFTLKKKALELLWSRFTGDVGFDRFCREQGTQLTRFASYCALAECHGGDWRQWPGEYQQWNSLSVARFTDDRAERVHFYQWVQWLLDEQLAKAAAEIPLTQDLPIGVDPGGADAWGWRDLFAESVSIGTPPDEYNIKGQDWGLPALVPWKLRAGGYAPFIETVRGALRHAGGLRIDHVMGLFRLYWIPQGADPSAGAFVRYNADELLAILSLESQRARAYIVGEDLGTVEENARKQLSGSRILSYRLLWFEKDPPAHYPEQALSAITTHDLPTVAGLWSGADLEAQRKLGLQPNEEGTTKIRNTLRSMADVGDDVAVETVIGRAYDRLAQAPSAIIVATLEDALAVHERPNMPASTTGSWCLALPKSLENLQSSPLAQAIATSLQNRPDAFSSSDEC